MLDFNLCSFKCMVVSKVQFIIDILSIMIYCILGHMFVIELDLFMVVCLYIDNLNIEWIVVPFINKIMDSLD